LNREYNGISCSAPNKLTSDKKGTIGEDGSWNWDDVKCGQAHVKLCQRMKARNAAPQVNDRISFVQVFDKEDERLHVTP
jgi:hypothetical protein